MSHHASQSIDTPGTSDRPPADALAALGTALLARFFLLPSLGLALPFVTVYVALAIAAWRGGYRTALIVALPAYVACAYMLAVPGDGHFGFRETGGLPGLVEYVIVTGTIVGFAEAARVWRQRQRETRALLDAVLAGTGAAMITTDPNGRITSINDAAESITGWTELQATGQLLEDIYRVINASERAKRTPGSVFVSTLIRKDGSERAVRDHASVLCNEEGVPAGCVLVVNDVSERRQLEHVVHAQLQSARLLTALIESSNDAIVVTSLDGTIHGWNAAAENVFDCSMSEAVGRKLTIFTPPDRLGETEALFSRVASGERVEHFVTERLRATGESVHVSVTMSPVRDERGHVVRVACIVRDITPHFSSGENVVFWPGRRR